MGHQKPNIQFAERCKPKNAMDKRTLITLLVSLFYAVAVHGQESSTDSDNLPSELIGTWYLDGSLSKDTLTFRKESTAPFNHGSRIEIHENGDFVDAYSARCGNDSKLHYDKGKWKINLSEMILTTTIPIDYSSMVYKIEQVTENRLVLVEVK